MLKRDAELESSAVVANNAMNRERGLTGANSYARELGFDPAEFLRARVMEAGAAAWLDLCCGEGNAVIEGARRLAAKGVAGVSVVGVDLVGRIGGGLAGTPAADPPGLELVVASVADWTPGARRFDLITCVHGLHYLGDKLAVLSRAAGWLTDGGVFAADFDASLIRDADGLSMGPRVIRALRRAGATYDGRGRRMNLCGPVEFEFGASYLGADDGIGPGYTGQPDVASHYEWPTGSGWK